MLMIAGLMGLLMAGVAADMTAVAGRDDMDDGDFPDEAETGSDEDGFADAGAGADGIGEAVDPVDDTTDETVEDADTITPPFLGEDEDIEGSDHPDALMGYDGNDLMRGHGGMDDLRGGQGNDTLNGGTGDDWLQGESDYGPGGDDLLLGGAGDDTLAGQGGNDSTAGDAGDDMVLGGDGDDSLQGGDGNDWLMGNAGKDSLAGGAGDDDLTGGDGDDSLDGGAGTDWLHGGQGGDTLVAGAGDFLEGQEGADHYVLQGSPETLPVIAGFDDSQDMLELHLPERMADTAQVDLARDDDDSLLLRVDGHAVARLIGAVTTGSVQIHIPSAGREFAFLSVPPSL